MYVLVSKHGSDNDLHIINAPLAIHRTCLCVPCSTGMTEIWNAKFMKGHRCFSDQSKASPNYDLRDYLFGLRFS